MLLSYLQQKVTSINACKSCSDDILRSFGIDPETGVRLRVDADVRALFIHYYLRGQDLILRQCIEAIASKLEALEDETT